MRWKQKRNKTKQKHLVGTAHDSHGIPPLHSYGYPLEEVVIVDFSLPDCWARWYPGDLRKDSEPGSNTSEVVWLLAENDTEVSGKSTSHIS